MLIVSAVLILLERAITARGGVGRIDDLAKRFAGQRRRLARAAVPQTTGNCVAVGFWMGAALAVVLPFSTTQAVAQNSQICSGYARDYAHRNTRGRAVTGAARGAIGGALIGGVANSNRGARRGARIGGATGAVVGGVSQAEDFTVLYNQAYRRCMRR